jgi:acetyl esterase/lipase
MKRIQALLLLIPILGLAIEATALIAPKPAPTVFAATGPTTQAMTRIADIRYGDAPGVANLLDIYQPIGITHPLPTIVWIHGGGWAAGDKSPCRVARFVDQGYVVVSLNYRFAPKNLFPAQLYDCKGAIRFLRANAAKYDIDPDHIGVWGASAGGHLVALLGTSGDDPKPEGDVGGNLTQSSRVQAVCDWFGPTDMSVFVAESKEAGIKLPNGPALITGLFGGAPDTKPELVQQANPIAYITAKIEGKTAKSIPPFLIMHGDRDPLVPVAQSRLLSEALQKAGVKQHFVIVKNAGHGDGFDRPEVIKIVSEFFDKALRQKS